MYCPWETFKRIALENVDFDCIQQPLKDSTETLYADSTAVPTDGADDDDALDAWTLIGLTAAACTVFFLVLQVVVFQYQKRKQQQKQEQEYQQQ